MQLYLLEDHTVRLIGDNARLENVYHVVEAKLSRPSVSQMTFQLFLY